MARYLKFSGVNVPPVGSVDLDFLDCHVYGCTIAISDKPDFL
nr:MAG TPA: hypothetical protein [Bacteriophage sp.]